MLTHNCNHFDGCSLYMPLNSVHATTDVQIDKIDVICVRLNVPEWVYVCDTVWHSQFQIPLAAGVEVVDDVAVSPAVAETERAKHRYR